MEYKHPGGLVHKVQVEADDTDEREERRRQPFSDHQNSSDCGSGGRNLSGITG